MEKGRRPGRLRHSWEARCRLVSLMLAGVEPAAAAVTCGFSRASAYRLLGSLSAGWVGRVARSTADREALSASPVG